MSRRIPVAVVGPHDLTERTCQLAAEFSALEAVPYSYDNEAETEALVVASRHHTAALLFTGVIPYRIAEGADLLDRPATYVSYTGASLYRALLRLTLDGRSIERFSIDTLSASQVSEALGDVGLSAEGVKVFEYATKATSDEIVAFHRSAHERNGGVAISCLRSAYEVLDTELPAIRLSPALQSIRVALQTVLLESLRDQTQHAQVALGIIELDRDDDLVNRHSSSLGASIVRLGEGTYLLITTRGLLEEATGAFTQLPMLTHLAVTHPQVRIGFGIGRSAADAEVLARAAVRRARALGAHAAAVALNADTIIDLQAGGPAELERPSLPLLAQRIGMRPETLAKLSELMEFRADHHITAAEVAEFFAVEQRAGRRILSKLARAGVAEMIGTKPDGGSGRPPMVYRVDL